MLVFVRDVKGGVILNEVFTVAANSKLNVPDKVREFCTIFSPPDVNLMIELLNENRLRLAEPRSDSNLRDKQA